MISFFFFSFLFFFLLISNFRKKKLVASHIQLPSEPEKHLTQDNDFIADVLFGIENRYSEDIIRAKFQEYVQGIIDIVFDDAEYPDDATKKKVATNNQQRIESWKQTITFKNYKNVRFLFLFSNFFKKKMKITN